MYLRAISAKKGRTDHQGRQEQAALIQSESPPHEPMSARVRGIIVQTERPIAL